jgi:NACHT domain
VTEQHRDIEVTGGRGVVVGNYATVFQSFGEDKRPVSSFIRSAQFRALIDERTRDFMGRGFIFDGIEQLLAKDEFPSGYVMIRGEPGIGKTAIAAMLVLRGSYVHHFNIAAENIRSPRQFLENVCAQLIVKYQLDHPTLPPQANEDSGFLSQLLTEAADRARQHDELPVVVVVDALDEAEDTPFVPTANRLFLPRALPPGVFFIITTREEADHRLDVDHLTEIWLRDDDPANLRDVARYIEAFIERHQQAMHERIQAWDIDSAAFVAEMTTLSEGNFMYLVYVLPEISTGRLSQQAADGIGGLPRGLKGYYQRHWRDMKDADPGRFSAQQRPVLCFLAICREPVTIPQLTEWTHLEPGEVNSVMTDWREFLNEDSGTRPSRYRIYHRSFAEFLDAEENLKWYHSQIATAALSKIPGFFPGDSPYS